MTLRAEMRLAFCSVEDVERDEASQSDQSTQLLRVSTPALHTRPILGRHENENERTTETR